MRDRRKLLDTRPQPYWRSSCAAPVLGVPGGVGDGTDTDLLDGGAQRAAPERVGRGAGQQCLAELVGEHAGQALQQQQPAPAEHYLAEAFKLPHTPRELAELREAARTIYGR